jgi:Protein of unknown function (DUF3095)
MTNGGAEFYAKLPTIADFAAAVRPENHTPLPDDWVVGFSDVVGSTKAIEQGRYKAVNMVGAGVIAAVANSIHRRSFPFVFGGDGASFAVSQADAEVASRALQAMAAYSEDEFKLQLRVAVAPVHAIRAAGGDIRVTRYEASPDCAYAMFSGGGLSWFERQAKGGAFLLERAPPGILPDLSGLSCRWGLAPAKHGIILSAMVAPLGSDPRFSALLDDIVRFVATVEDSGRPVTMESLQPGPTRQAIGFEALVTRTSGVARWSAWLTSALLYALGYTAYRLRLKTRDFDMNTYMAGITTNADFRKFDDGLRLTLDCTPTFADELERRLDAAAAYAQYGTFRQTKALMTCFVPTTENLGGAGPKETGGLGHIHFVDGAGGGYTMAAKAMKHRGAAGIDVAKSLG